MTDTPWILATQAPPGCICQRCGAQVAFADAPRVDDYVATSRAFIATHTACEPAPAAVEVRRAGGQMLPELEDLS